MSDESLFSIDALFGYIKSHSRFRRDGLRFIGEGRSMHYDTAGNLTKDSGWIPTGCDMIAPDEGTATQINAMFCNRVTSSLKMDDE